MSKRVRLTDRVLEGIIAATMLVEAGSPADLTGTNDDDPEANRLHEAACDGFRWAQQEKARRAAKKKAKVAA